MMEPKATVENPISFPKEIFLIPDAEDEDDFPQDLVEGCGGIYWAIDPYGEHAVKYIRADLVVEKRQN